eukprot:GEMP01006946.1.p1 GENE.GEMP01006946.1~~GEMP01006946.1.p1  ORF type:complete len:701 (+),score=136.13 GEMP01006946.1:257-2359(+)
MQNSPMSRGNVSINYPLSPMRLADTSLSGASVGISPGLHPRNVNPSLMSAGARMQVQLGPAHPPFPQQPFVNQQAMLLHGRQHRASGPMLARGTSSQSKSNVGLIQQLDERRRKLGRWDAEGHEITDDVSGPSKSHLSGSDCSPSAIRADQKSPSLTCRGIFMPDGRISEDKRFAPGFTAHQAMGKAHAMGRPMDNSLTNTICVHPGVHPGKQPITVPHTHTPLSLGSPGTEASASPCGGPLANANWEGFTGHRQLGSGSLGSVQSLGGGGSPVIRKSCVANMSPMNIFGNIGKLDFSAALRNASGPCSCCRSSNRMDMVDVGSVKIPYITVSRPFNRHHANFAQELWDAFGEDVVEKIFDEEGILPAQVKCLANAGLNHEFIAISTKHLVKLIVPSGPSQAGEAHEMEFLRKYHPAIAEDPSVCFPKKCFRLLTGGNPAVYDVVALEYHEGAMSVREITQIFERAPKDDKNRLFVDMYNLVGEQVPRVLRRYQNRHLRKHGDGKADNILVTSKGRIVMCDMGSTFNDSLKPCDRDEYLRSIPTLDAQLAEMKRRFDEVFRNTQEVPDVSPEEELPQQQRNAYVLQEIRKLLAAQKSGPGASTPPMGMGGGLLGGIGAPGLFPQRPIGNQFMGNRFSATGLSAPFGQGSLLTANFGVAGGGLLNMPRSSEVPSLGGGLLNMNLGAPPPMMDLSGSMNRLP